MAFSFLSSCAASSQLFPPGVSFPEVVDFSLVPREDTFLLSWLKVSLKAFWKRGILPLGRGRLPPPGKASLGRSQKKDIPYKKKCLVRTPFFL